VIHNRLNFGTLCLLISQVFLGYGVIKGVSNNRGERIVDRTQKVRGLKSESGFNKVVGDNRGDCCKDCLIWLRFCAVVTGFRVTKGGAIIGTWMDCFRLGSLCCSPKGDAPWPYLVCAALFCAAHIDVCVCHSFLCITYLLIFINLNTLIVTFDMTIDLEIRLHFDST